MSDFTLVKIICVTTTIPTKHMWYTHIEIFKSSLVYNNNYDTSSTFPLKSVGSLTLDTTFIIIVIDFISMPTLRLCNVTLKEPGLICTK